MLLTDMTPYWVGFSSHDCLNLRSVMNQVITIVYTSKNAYFFELLHCSLSQFLHSPKKINILTLLCAYILVCLNY